MTALDSPARPPMSWDDVLTTMEEELDAQEAMLRAGDIHLVPKFEPPTTVGPLPAELLDRAVHLQSRIDLLATFVRYQLTATQGDLKHVSRAPSAGSVLALYLDATA